MFERYTEQARRVIFFAKYEASQSGSPHVETEHLLLGLLRQDKQLAGQFLHSDAVVSIRKQIESRTAAREIISTSVDLPLSHQSKRVFAFAKEEAERLNQRHVGTEHLLMGLLREDNGLAAEILREHGLGVPSVHEKLRTLIGSDLDDQQRQAPPSPGELPFWFAEMLLRATALARKAGLSEIGIDTLLLAIDSHAHSGLSEIDALLATFAGAGRESGGSFDASVVLRLSGEVQGILARLDKRMTIEALRPALLSAKNNQTETGDAP